MCYSVYKKYYQYLYFWVDPTQIKSNSLEMFRTLWPNHTARYTECTRTFCNSSTTVWPFHFDWFFKADTKIKLLEPVKRFNGLHARKLKKTEAVQTGSTSVLTVLIPCSQIQQSTCRNHLRSDLSEVFLDVTTFSFWFMSGLSSPSSVSSRCLWSLCFNWSNHNITRLP